ncbi:hypothetical protein JCM3765_006261 [Sporobolomyces pararoseus]
MRITLALITLVTTVFAAASDPAPTDVLPQLDIIYNLQQDQIDRYVEGFTELLVAGIEADRNQSAVCHQECFYFAEENGRCPLIKNTDDQLFCICSSELMADTTKCAACLDQRDSTSNFTRDADGWIDFCDTMKDKWAKLSTYSSIFTRTQTTALTTATTRWTTNMWFSPYSGLSSSYSDIFTRGGQPTNFAGNSASSLSSNAIPRETAASSPTLSSVGSQTTTSAVAAVKDSGDQGNGAGSMNQMVFTISLLAASFFSIYNAL